MKNAKGTFTVWYMPDASGSPADEHHRHGITVRNRDELMEKAKRIRPDRTFIKAIIWQHGGGSSHIWFYVRGRDEAACWVDDVCQRALGA